MDLEPTSRGLLRGFRPKVTDVSCGKLAARVRELMKFQHAGTSRAIQDRAIEPRLASLVGSCPKIV